MSEQQGGPLLAAHDTRLLLSQILCQFIRFAEVRVSPNAICTGPFLYES